MYSGPYHKTFFAQPQLARHPLVGQGHGFKNYPGKYGGSPPLRKVIEEYSYGLSDVIGQGLTSKVFLGRHDPSSEKVVVKVVDLKEVRNEEAKQNLLGEIEVMRRLKHEGVLELKDIYTTANNCYIITEHCEQGDLEQLCKARGTFSEEQALSVMLDVLAACRYLFEHSIIHRDLKSSNILLKKDGRAVLADFGFAIPESKLAEKQVYNVGSPLYMPPETLLKNKYSFKSDIFGLGIIYYELLFGVSPWESKTENELIQKLMTKPLNLNVRGKPISKESQDFLAKALEIDVKKRMGPEEYGEQIESLRAALGRAKPKLSPQPAREDEEKQQ